MIIGCTRERKRLECRVGLTPDNALAYIQAGHTVLIERGAGAGSGFTDREYSEQGAEVVETAAEICERCEIRLSFFKLSILQSVSSNLDSITDPYFFISWKWTSIYASVIARQMNLIESKYVSSKSFLQSNGI